MCLYIYTLIGNLFTLIEQVSSWLSVALRGSSQRSALLRSSPWLSESRAEHGTLSKHPSCSLSSSHNKRKTMHNLTRTSHLERPEEQRGALCEETYCSTEQRGAL